MIETHVFNSLLIPELKQNFWFAVLNFINGWVAPAFLFVAGFVFFISIERNINEIRKFKYLFWRRLGRILLIFIAGYSLHVPYFSLYNVIHAANNKLIIEFYNVDILQCIAAGLLFLFILRLIIKSDKNFYYLVLSITVIIIFTTPFIWKINISNYFPIYISNYFDNLHGSNFPLFPWIAYIFAGVITSKYFFKWKQNNKEKKFEQIILITGLILVLLSHILFSGYMPFDYGIVKANPIFFFQRLGYIFVLFFLCWFYAESKKSNKSFMLDVSRESLLIYWLHLQFLYRKNWNEESLVSYVNQNFNLIECIAAFLIITLFMILVAKIWGSFKLNRKYTSILTFCIIFFSIIIFLIN